jgi:uncharacterized protein YPO0396
LAECLCWQNLVTPRGSGGSAGLVKRYHFIITWLRSLRKLPPVEREAKELLLQHLETRELRVGDLTYIATIPDPRIRAWFERRIDATNSHLRSLAKRVAARGTALQKTVAYVDQQPDRSTEMFADSPPNRSLILI